MRRLWTAVEVAEYLAVKPATVYLWAKQQTIPFVRLTRGARKQCIRFRPEEIERWVKKKSTP